MASEVRYALGAFEHRKHFNKDSKIINKTQSMIKKSKKKNESQ